VAGDELRFEDVYFDYGRLRAPDRDVRRLAVPHGINLTIAPGERVGLVGPSGAGKSTLVNEPAVDASLRTRCSSSSACAFGASLIRRSANDAVTSMTCSQLSTTSRVLVSRIHATRLTSGSWVRATNPSAERRQYKLGIGQRCQVDKENATGESTELWTRRLASSTAISGQARAISSRRLTISPPVRPARP
jgi:predicted ABC-type transport system involved in lysophospholipase L1 biosynthesis ATPase subunit